MKQKLFLLTLLSLVFVAPAQAQITLGDVEFDDNAAGAASAQITGFDLGAGETLVVMLAMENNGSVSDIQFNSSSVTWDSVTTVNEGVQRATVYVKDGLSAATGATLDFTFSDTGNYAVSAMGLSGVAGISAAGTFGEPDSNLPFAINYGAANGGFVVGAMADNTFSAGAPLTIAGDNIDHAGNSAYIVQRGGGVGGGSAGMALAYGDVTGATGGYTETFTDGTGGSSSRNAGALVAFYPAGLAQQNLTWSGGISGSPNTWDTFVSSNWNTNANLFQPNDNVTFDDTAGVSTTVDINASVLPATVTVDSNTNNYTFDGAGSIGGTASLTKSGSSTLVLNTLHSYTGGTVINAGIVDIGDPGAAGTGSITLNGTGQFHVGDVFNNTVENDFVVNGTNVIENNATGAGLMNLLGDISGAGDLTINNNSGGGLNGTDFSGDNSGFTGSITLGGADGVFLRIRGSVAGAGTDVAWDLGSGGRLYTRDLAASETITLGSLAGTGGFIGSNAGGSSSDIEYRIGSLNTSTTFSGVVENNGGTTSITKIGTGTLTLDGANTYTGDTSVEAGTLSIGSDFLADAADVLLLTGATFDLNFAGTDVIDELFFDGVSQTTGTWGAVGSGAANESSFFTGTGLLSVTTGPAFAPEDLNMDGFVDGLDLGILLGNWGTSTTPDMGELNGTPPVDGLDLGILLGAWNPPPAAATAAVPEPTSVVLVMLGLAGLASSRRR